MESKHTDKFNGIYPAMVTPMRDDLSLHVEQIRRLVDFHVSAGVDGLWVTGASGEAELLSVDERRAVTEAVMAAAGGRVKVIVHVGSVAPRQSFDLAAHAEACGVDAVACTPPHFFPASDRMVVDHYRRLADACGLPLFMYHLPGCTHVPVTVGLAEQLLEIETVRGIKFSEHNLALMRMIRNLDPQRLTLLFGMDSVLLAGLVMGADGGVGGTYNYIPGAFVRIYDLHRRGDFAAAQTLQRQVTDFNRDLSEGLPFQPVSKFAMSLCGIDCGPARPPFSPLTEAEQRLLRERWEEHAEWLAGIR